MKRSDPLRFDRIIWRKDPWRIKLSRDHKLYLTYQKKGERPFKAKLSLWMPWKAFEDIEQQLWDAWEEYVFPSE